MLFISILLTGIAQANFVWAQSPPQEPPYTDTESIAESEEPKTSDSSPETSETPPSLQPKMISGAPTPEQERRASEQKSTKVELPGAAAKGLLRIDKEGQYYYRTTPSPQKNAASVMFGSFSPTQIKSVTGQDVYKQVYGNSASSVFLASWEWQFLKMAIGKVGGRVNSGLILAQGNGRFASDYAENRNKTPKEKFTLIGMPNGVDFVYRMQLWDKQPLIPYGFGGGDYFMFMETRNDNKPNKYMGALAAHAGAGVCFSFNWLDRLNMSRLDQEYGINNIMLSAEFRQVVGLKQDFDLTSSIVAFGITADY